MKEKLQNLFRGRQGMDELSKLLFWTAAAGCALALVLPGALRALLISFSTMFLAVAFLRAFSRDLPRREAENLLLLRYMDRKKRERAAAKDRRAHRREYRYFKCPGCGCWLRVPRGKGKIHINCRCGYTLYRRS